MDDTKKDYLTHDDYSRIGREIVNILGKHGCTYLDAEDVLRYVNGQLRNQKVKQHED